MSDTEAEVRAALVARKALHRGVFIPSDAEPKIVTRNNRNRFIEVRDLAVEATASYGI